MGKYETEFKQLFNSLGEKYGEAVKKDGKIVPSKLMSALNPDEKEQVEQAAFNYSLEKNKSPLLG